jgi:hypothetical protein
LCSHQPGFAITLDLFILNAKAHRESQFLRSVAADSVGACKLKTPKDMHTKDT